jgi:leucyl-tRNA synthetase
MSEYSTKWSKEELEAYLLFYCANADFIETDEEKKFIHSKVSDNVYTKTYSFNTLIASCMEALNALSSQNNDNIFAEGYYILSKILEPIVPHISSEIADRLFDSKNFNTKINIDNTIFDDEFIELAITINGKKRETIEISKEDTKDIILEKSKAKISKWIDGKNIIKEIYVPNKLINIVVKD